MPEEMYTPQNSAPASIPNSGGRRGSVGPTIGIVVVVLVLVLGALYFWGKKLVEEESLTPPPTEEAILGATDPALESLQSQGASDEVTAIEEDLGKTDLGTLDTELQQIESEVGNL
ncbi:MAG: hypothetical protein HY457_02335 [Parcubacteria group bacterium]|nr:hypothetical protein [Parcubacteria group bacterium]